ncbi:MAG: OmpA family protein [Methyloprofundus sp.]|nr:OmpA family protein [Methyloprofundus sp.]
MASNRPTAASSAHLEELLNHTNEQNQHSWLMSYLDVFVLMLMLVISLISISDIQTEQSASEKASLPKTVKHNPVAAQPIDAATVEQTISIQTATHEPLQPVAAQTIADLQNAHAEPLETPVTEKPITPIEPPQVAQKTAEQADKKTPETTQESKDWQEAFKQQLETLGIADAINLQFKNSRIHIEIQDNILFDSADALITLKGEKILLPLSKLLQQSVGIIYIEGHTDNRPIATQQFPSNWELGAARALSVLHFLSQESIPESRLRATTYADTQPISNNDEPTGREKNRRVNLIIKMPDMPLQP